MTAKQVVTPGHDIVVRDDDGNMLLNADDIALAAAGECFDNVKVVMRVDGINRSRSATLHSVDIAGTDFLRAGTYVCLVSASPKERYVAFRLDTDGRVRPLVAIPAEHDDWPIRMWPALLSAGVPDER